MTNPTTEILWHGHTLTTIDDIARTAAYIAYGKYILDPTDRYHTAWSAIVELLATSPEPPTRGDLIYGGAHAVSRAGRDYRRSWGMGRNTGSGEGDMPSYARYWELARRATPSPEAAIVDRMALHQIWPRLSLTHRQVLHALAIHDGDHVAAAGSLGKTVGAFRTHLKSARAAYRALWHEHETPSRMWGKSGQSGQRNAMQTVVNRRQQRARNARKAAA